MPKSHMMYNSYYYKTKHLELVIKIEHFYHYIYFENIKLIFPLIMAFPI